MLPVIALAWGDKSDMWTKHPDVAKSYVNMATVYKSQGKYDEALEYHQKSLSIRLTTHGDMHPAVAASYGNMAIVYELTLIKNKRCRRKSLCRSRW